MAIRIYPAELADDPSFVKTFAEDKDFSKTLELTAYAGVGGRISAYSRE
ncbi:MAG TPA: hypothetical protein VK908_02770 [Jiangellales bacterium]|nr:hypothetical protein [Jiangellales bacterium]